ncbi:hypothetical protein FB45DRAFT_867364 [Roridomyces roridus]|uniref:Uncharacterized protein n=1 Tax=Roridomyces roridus TaxID=1738132 RepID=A0AAD7FPQ8_9AGAR|nr:hypothetical protein FB45DRAFT_867364 [Roridomyces roridus]
MLSRVFAVERKADAGNAWDSLGLIRTTGTRDASREFGYSTRPSGSAQSGLSVTVHAEWFSGLSPTLPLGAFWTSFKATAPDTDGLSFGSSSGLKSSNPGAVSVGSRAPRSGGEAQKRRRAHRDLHGFAGMDDLRQGAGSASWTSKGPNKRALNPDHQYLEARAKLLWQQLALDGACQASHGILIWFLSTLDVFRWPAAPGFVFVADVGEKVQYPLWEWLRLEYVQEDEGADPRGVRGCRAVLHERFVEKSILTVDTRYAKETLPVRECFVVLTDRAGLDDGRAKEEVHVEAGWERDWWLGGGGGFKPRECYDAFGDQVKGMPSVMCRWDVGAVTRANVARAFAL